MNVSCSSAPQSNSSFVQSADPKIDADLNFNNKNCEPYQISKEKFLDIFNTVRDQNFPTLSHLKIELGLLSEKQYFFEIRPQFLSLFKNATQRTYLLSVNPLVLNCPLQEIGLRAIFIHELQHLNDYNSWSTFQIINHLFKFLSSESYRAQYERGTDLKTLMKGFGHGLLAHRAWIYQWLDQDELQIKKRIYLTPEEIQNQLKLVN